MSLLNNIMFSFNVASLVLLLLLHRKVKQTIEHDVALRTSIGEILLPTRLALIIVEIHAELMKADAKYKADPMVEARVGHKTILCELTELEREIERHPALQRPKAMRKEAIQVAAMAVKFIRDICK